MDFGVFAIGRRLATEPDGGLLIGLGPDVVRLSEFEARWWRQARLPDASGRRPERQEVSAALGLDEFEHYETTDRLYELGVCRLARQHQLLLPASSRAAGYRAGQQRHRSHALPRRAARVAPGLARRA